MSEELVEITLNGETYMVNSEMAKAMQAQHDQLNDASLEAQQKLQTQIEELSKKVDGIPVIEPIEEPIDSDLSSSDLKFFGSPTEELNSREEKLKAEVKDELRKEYTEKEAADLLWKGFYKENSDLVTSKVFVDAICSRDYNKYKDMKSEEFYKVLGEDTRAELLRSMPGKKKEENPVVVLEGGQGQTPFETPPVEEKVVPLSQQINARRAARRKARVGK